MHLWRLIDTFFGMIQIQTHCDNPYPQLTTHTDTLSRNTRVSQYQKVKPIWILLKQETVSGSGISWVMFKSAPRSRQITMPAPNNSVFTGRVPFLPPSQQHQSTEGNIPTHTYTHRDNPGQHNNQTQTHMDNPDPQLTTYTHALLICNGC